MQNLHSILKSTNTHDTLKLGIKKKQIYFQLSTTGYNQWFPRVGHFILQHLCPQDEYFISFCFAQVWKMKMAMDRKWKIINVHVKNLL